MVGFSLLIRQSCLCLVRPILRQVNISSSFLLKLDIFSQLSVVLFIALGSVSILLQSNDHFVRTLVFIFIVEV